MRPSDPQFSSVRRVVTIVVWTVALAISPHVVSAAEKGAGDVLWSLRPVVRPELPAVRDGSWVRSPVDRFVLSKLEAKGWQPAAAVARDRLIRRAYFDLWGLPPSPEEVAAFIADTSPDAYERLVDRLLASPH